MANKSKIFGEIEVKVRELCEMGYNASYIGKQVGLAKDTINLWAKKNGYVLAKKIGPKLVELEPKILEMLKQGIPRKTIQRQLGVHFTAITEIAKKHGITDLRTRKDAALERVLTKNEVESKMPSDGSIYIGHDQERNMYIFKCTRTDKIFEKTSAKIHQGSPYGKSGKRVTEEDFKERLKDINHTLKEGTFSDLLSPVVVICNKGHERSLKRASYALSFGCADCNNKGTSKIERSIMEWVKTYYPNAYKFKFPNNVTRHKEIDIYIPELKLGIEYCGIYHHSEDLTDQIIEGREEEEGSNGKHYKKMLLANNLGIRLITIFGDEWDSRGRQIRNFLIAAMRKNEYKIMARDCEIVEIDKRTGKNFLEENHIQGADEAMVYFGLFFKGDLAGVMSAGRHPQRHSTDDTTVYLNRLAFAPNLTVTGGASKLLSYFKKYAKSKGYTRIVSWSDNRWSDGKVYQALGFKFESESEKGRGLSDGSIWPDFWYIYKNKRITRWVAENNGLNDFNLDKIWDCGKKRWVMELK